MVTIRFAHTIRFPHNKIHYEKHMTWDEIAFSSTLYPFLLALEYLLGNLLGFHDKNVWILYKCNYNGSWFTKKKSFESKKLHYHN